MNRVIKIGVPCSPSTVISHELVKAYKVLISYGGYVAGANKTYYCTSMVNLGPCKYLTLLDGDSVTVTNTFIVEYKPVNLVKVVSDVTEHLNYNKSVPVCEKCVTTQFLELAFGDTYEIVDYYVTGQDDKCVLKFSLTEKL